MKKLVKYLCLMTLVAGTAACDIQSVVDDLEAEAKAKAEAQLKDAFSSAVTEVALKAVQQGQGGEGGPQGAPGYGQANTDMSMNETFEINDTFTEDGATFTMTGKISMAMEGMNSTMTMDMKATFTNMKVKLEDGTEVLVNGEQTIKGDFVTEMSDANDPSTMVMKMTFSTAGKISNVEGTASSTFEINMNFDSTTGVMKITGTIDGEPYSEEFEMPLPSDMQGENPGPGATVYGSCLRLDGDVCYDYTGASYATFDQATCGNYTDGDYTASPMACDTTFMLGKCTYFQGTPQEHDKWSNTDESVNCANAGGVWAAK